MKEYLFDIIGICLIMLGILLMFVCSNTLPSVAYPWIVIIIGFLILCYAEYRDKKRSQNEQ